MEITPDEIIYWQSGGFKLSATIVFTWVVIAFLAVCSVLITRRLSLEKNLSKSQMFLETLIKIMRNQIGDVMQKKPDKYLPLLGSLYIFIAVSNFFSFVPGYEPPTGSIQTTSVLAGIVFFAVPIYGISEQGLKNYLKQYLKPSFIMLPFNVIGEFSRTLAMSVRLFGNMMSGTLIIAILLSLAPLFFPVIMNALELLIGQIQAYIFAVLATVYIGSAAKVREKTEKKNKKEKSDNNQQEDKNE